MGEDSPGAGFEGWELWEECPGQLGSGLVEGAEDGLADLAGHGVDKQEEEDGDQGQQQQQEAPAPAPDEEDEGLQRVHKPVEGFRAAVGEDEVSGAPRLPLRLEPRLPCLPLTWASPRARAPSAPSPLAASLPPPWSAAQLCLHLPLEKEETEAALLGGLRPAPLHLPCPCPIPPP